MEPQRLKRAIILDSVSHLKKMETQEFISAITRKYNNIKFECGFLDVNLRLQRYARIHIDAKNVILLNSERFIAFCDFMEKCRLSGKLPASYSLNGFTIERENKKGDMMLLFYEKAHFLKRIRMRKAVWDVLTCSYGETIADLDRLLYNEAFINDVCKKMAENVAADLLPEEARDLFVLRNIFLTEFPADLILKAQISIDNYAKVHIVEEIIHRFPEVIINRIWVKANEAV